MKNDSQLNRSHGNPAGMRHSEERNFFHTADQSSDEALQQELREGYGWKKKENGNQSGEECGKKKKRDFRANCVW